MPWWETDTEDSPGAGASPAVAGVRVVDLADQYGLTTNDMLDLCDYAGVAVSGGADELTEVQVARLEAALAGADPDAIPNDLAGAAPAAPGELGGWVTPDPPAPPAGSSSSGGGNGSSGDLLDASRPAVSRPRPAAPGKPAKDDGKVRKARLNPLGLIALPLALLPILKMFIKVPFSIPPFAGGIISTIISMALMAPAWTLADRAEEAERQDPDRWRGEYLALWAKALATLCLLGAIVWTWIRAFKGISGI